MLKLGRRALTSTPLVSRWSSSFTRSDGTPMFSKILIANRGEIACRVQRTAKKLGVRTVAVYSDADANAQHVKMADEAYRLGPPPAAESYLLFDEILRVAKASGAQAIHPGYGFLSENAEFCKACAAAGVEFIGPPVAAIEAMGSKSASKDIMIAAGVPVTPGYHGTDQSFERIKAESAKIGYPVLLKAVLGGGGKGMRIVDREEDLKDNMEACVREAKASFASTDILVEKYLRRPRHVELQIFGDKHGNVVHLFERDCSVQRRHQKVLEEAPAPHMSEALRKKMGDAAVAAAKAVGYVGAGTVEFLLDEDESFYFMEMNTRLQVEHPVTEFITQQDLVELQLKVAAGQALPVRQEDLKIHGHAIEARIYAENPYNNFLPGSGTLHHLRLPPLSDKVRVDTGIVQGDAVSIFYDPMIAKLVVHASNRKEAIEGLMRALGQYQIVGLPTNIEFVARTAAHPEFMKGGVDTSFLLKHGDDLLTPFSNLPSHAPILTAVWLVLKQQHQTQRFEATVADAGSPWTSLQNFRSLDTFHRHFTLLHDDAPMDMDLASTSTDGKSYIVNGTTVQVHSVDFTTGDFKLTVGNETFTGTAVVLKHDVHLFCNDGTLAYEYKLRVPEPSYDSHGTSAGGAASLVTPMPGKVIKVMAKAGDTIVADQPLLIMEAMKMEHVLRAPRDGQVAEMNCEVGDFVSDGHVLVEMAPAAK
ncbi:acetyl-CoA carboxylase, biotin carboxylase subunit [Aphanomyces invadans]|uniref:Acetyl-CoA carboxylase, biotin carboxylase subunit n=1 Tax=Aphanomyces invadans TaxID=157072 RepID=A0A024U1L4_9STRA|nr:acetyl-CoA carboxylase, biotin carboxylase subunit [Aphanomyces invadans]ETV99482.1 acetyl-CoA carboxylase, biotin carboxylase subunit [Aphanomyces invadans]|eukprot:XP_008872038.1 acetyl-CoA carboxylase, biotin carboxylase subunit [Aphanomyces invadans]